MNLWKGYVLDDRQFVVNILLSVLLLFFIGIVLQIIFHVPHNNPIIFRGLIATVIFFIAVPVILYKISPAIVTRYVKSSRI